MRVGKGTTEREANRSLPEDWSQRIQAEGGIFGAVAIDIREACEGVLQGLDATAEFEEDSPQDFARTILACLDAADNEIRKGNSDLAALEAYRAGVQYERARMKFLWEADALRGMKVAGGSKNAAHKTNKRHEILREKRFAVFRELIPKIGVSNAAYVCEARGLGKAGTCQRQWDRRKNSDT